MFGEERLVRVVAMVGRMRDGRLGVVDGEIGKKWINGERKKNQHHIIITVFWSDIPTSAKIL